MSEKPTSQSCDGCSEMKPFLELKAHDGEMLCAECIEGLQECQRCEGKFPKAAMRSKSFGDESASFCEHCHDDLFVSWGAR